MPTFGLIAKTNPILAKFLEDTDERLQGISLIYNPFKGYVRSFNLKKEGYRLSIIKIHPIYADISIIGVVGIIGINFLWGLTLGMIPFLLIALSHFFYTYTFYTFMFRKGLKKAGYEEPYKIIKADETIDILLEL